MKEEKSISNYNPNKRVIQAKDLFANENGTIQVIQRKLINFLDQLGYGIFAKSNKFLRGTLIKKRDQVISELTETELRREVIDVLEKSDVEEIYVEKFQKSIPTILSKTQIFTLKPIDVELVKDSKDTAYFAFMNKMVKVTTDEIELIDYKDLPACIIDKQKKDFEIADEADSDGDFEAFCKLVTNDVPEWLKALKTAIGYLLLSNKEANENKAVIVYDYLLGNSNEANGGSGKSLIFNSALGQLKNVTIIDGKRYDPRSTRFMYQNVEVTTNIILIDDVNEKFNFDQIYSAVTEGFDIEKKGKPAVFLIKDEAPKFVITSNRLLKMDEGSSARRRAYELFLYNYFDDMRKPYDVFGRNFFSREWDHKEFNKFYHFVFSCVQEYLEHGLIEYIPEGVKDVKLRAEIGENWKEFFDNYLGLLLDGNNSVDRREVEEFAQGLFTTFTPHSITKKLKVYCLYKGYDFELINSGGVQRYQIIVPEVSNSDENDPEGGVDE